MACKLCGGNQAQFPAEVCIHFPGRENLDKPPVFEFPKVLICLECGFASFKVSETHLTLLADHTSTTRAEGCQDPMAGTREGTLALAS
jgi:hypothetical protein